MHTAPYFTAFGLMAIALSIRVVMQRTKHKVSLGDGGVKELILHQRVFGNFAEYVGLGLVMLAACEFVQAPVWYLHVVGGSLLIGRILHVVGLSKPSFQARVVGMSLTWVSLAFGAIGVTLFTLIAGRP